MKAYPQISAFRGEMPDCLAFTKLDGSNLRFQWDKKKGWWQFGTRTRLLKVDDPEYGAAIPLFLATMAEPLEKQFTDNKHIACREAIAYCEWFGPHSFAGQHDASYLQYLFPEKNIPNNDPKQLVLFDVNIHKRGFISPRMFVKHFNDLPIPAVVYEGPLTKQFFQDIRESKYPVYEGVVCKGGGEKSPHDLWMCKIKTLRYRDDLQRTTANWQLFWE